MEARAPPTQSFAAQRVPPASRRLIPWRAATRCTSKPPASSGVYQLLPPTALDHGALWLNIVTGSVTVTLSALTVPRLRPSPRLGQSSPPVNAGLYSEIDINSSSAGPANFYPDAELVPVANAILNPSFENGTHRPTPFTGHGYGGASAASNWSVW